MKLIHQKDALIPLVKERRTPAKIVGFVPTMGALHQGHFSLISKARSESDLVVVSIFVNPTQFDNPDDLENYPKNLDKDMQKLKDRFENLIIFAPDIQEIYGTLPKAEHFEFGILTHKMEGKSRDGHFDGVGTVLKKLFEIVRPDKAFFGEKDYQQLVIVKKLVQLLDLDIDIIGCPIKREANGLARSSRNKRLTGQQREQAALLYQSLQKAKRQFGTKRIVDIVADIKMDFERHPEFELVYFEIADADTLATVQTVEKNKKYRAFVAVYIGKEVRLIDNMALN